MNYIARWARAGTLLAVPDSRFSFSPQPVTGFRVRTSMPFTNTMDTPPVISANFLLPGLGAPWCSGRSLVRSVTDCELETGNLLVVRPLTPSRSGRRTASITYCVTYIFSCFTKHSPAYGVLMVGRLLGGIATSLLFSAFESWLVAEHFKRGFDAQWLSLTFSRAIFVGNGLVAILAGLLANFLVKNMALGPVVPFDAAATFLTIGFVIILMTWPENYGDASDKAPFSAQFVKVGSKECSILLIIVPNHSSPQAWNTIKSDPKIASLGAIQSLFEGSMYTFVFLWTPALSPNGEEIPHGFIFALFMLACMLGSSIAAKLLVNIETVPVENYMRYVFGVSAGALFIPVMLRFVGQGPMATKEGGLTFNGQLLLFGFLVFEACVGVFWPSIMKMRSHYIPEESRSTIMNFFRIPLNLFVCIVLYNVSAFEISTMFTMCSAFLGLAAYLQNRLLILSKQPSRRAIAGG